MSFNTSSQNICIRDNELQVYYTAETRDSQKPCRFCGSKDSVLEEIIVVTSVCDENYVDVDKNSPLFEEAQTVIRKMQLHERPSCSDDICLEKGMHELLGEDVVLDMVARGDYVPNPDSE